jgi:vacuolar-type H+-ATPase subunit H
MDILQLIDRLEELFNESKTIPLTRNVMVDEDKMLDIIDQMLGQRDRVLAQAQEEANRTIEIARQKADQLVAKDMVAVEAQRRADQILAQARAEGENIRADADDYVMESLHQLEAELERNLNQVRNGIRTVEEEQARRAPSSTSAAAPSAEK